jgi:hypothetical protein
VRGIDVTLHIKACIFWTLIHRIDLRSGNCPLTLLSGGFGAKIEDLGHSLILEALLCGVH